VSGNGAQVYRVHAFAELALQDVIRAMSMQDVDVMRKYFSDEAWARWQHHYEDWPSPEWQALYRDINAERSMDPASPAAQALADRWLALAKADAATPAIRTGLMKAWADREHWPVSLRRRATELDVEAAARFINDALWIRWSADQDRRAQHGGPGVPRVTESRRALFREWEAVLDADPAGDRAQALAARWEAQLEAETGGDEEIKSDMRDFFRRRSSWPAGMRRYFASLYATDPDTWTRVTDFIERALACTRSGGPPSRPCVSS
jgi:hypothetical protein